MALFGTELGFSRYPLGQKRRGQSLDNVDWFACGGSIQQKELWIHDLPVAGPTACRRRRFEGKLLGYQRSQGSRRSRRLGWNRQDRRANRCDNGIRVTHEESIYVLARRRPPEQ